MWKGIKINLHIFFLSTTTNRNSGSLLDSCCVLQVVQAASFLCSGLFDHTWRTPKVVDMSNYGFCFKTPCWFEDEVYEPWLGSQMYETPPSVTVCLSLAVASQQFGFLVFSGASMCHACQVTGCTAGKNLLSKFNIKAVTHFTPKSFMSSWYHDLWLLDNDFYLLDNTGFEKANTVEKKKKEKKNLKQNDC